MEKHRIILQEALKYYRTADHLISITYPAIKDNKLLISIAENLNLASIKVITAILTYEKLYKRISILPYSTESIIEVFEEQTTERYKINKDTIKTVKELNLTIQQHKESPIEFSRKENYMICSEGYENITKLNIETLKLYSTQIKKLLGVALTLQ